MAKLIVLLVDLIRVAPFAKISALSFPSMSLCPGIQWRVTVAPFSFAFRAALIALIWQS